MPSRKSRHSIKSIKSIADSVYAALVANAGASPDSVSFDQFAHFMQGNGVEYRFGGSLGFGGKFWRDGDGWRVSCYREDETPERRKAIDATNARLAEKWADLGL